MYANPIVPLGSPPSQLRLPFASRHPTNSSVPVDVTTPDGPTTPRPTERVYQEPIRPGLPPPYPSIEYTSSVASNGSPGSTRAWMPSTCVMPVADAPPAATSAAAPIAATATSQRICRLMSPPLSVWPRATRSHHGAPVRLRPAGRSLDMCEVVTFGRERGTMQSLARLEGGCGDGRDVHQRGLVREGGGGGRVRRGMARVRVVGSHLARLRDASSRAR